jgi:hypothetical protein
MVEELAAILRLKQQLREAAVRLADEAGVHPDNRIALEYLRLVAKCQELEREIDIAAKQALSTEPPVGRDETRGPATV